VTTEGAQRNGRGRKGPSTSSSGTKLGVASTPAWLRGPMNFHLRRDLGREGISQGRAHARGRLRPWPATEHPAQLRNYLHGALQAGISGPQDHEALLMMVVYAGFPDRASARWSCGRTSWRRPAARASPIDLEA